MNKINNQFTSIEQITDRYLGTGKGNSTVNASGLSYEEILKQKQDVSESLELKFSKHATVRLADRGIELTDAQLERLNDGAQKAGLKGIRDSLVIVDYLAFIVNVPNKTVVTAMDSRETEENVFTNINGAEIM